MDKPVLEAFHLSRILDTSQGPKPLLRDVNFSLNRGRILTVVGPSGAGKSTLLRLLNRLDEPTGGHLLLQGQDYRGIDPRNLRRRIGMVMQRPYLFPGTVAGNIGYGPAQHGTILSENEIDELTQQVGLNGYAERDVGTLSGGEAQRISIARALANAPEALLLDEPTSALDETSRKGIENLLLNLVRGRNATCVWITHDVGQARRVADLVLKIEAGEAVGLGTPQELLHA